MYFSILSGTFLDGNFDPSNQSGKSGQKSQVTVGIEPTTTEAKNGKALRYHNHSANWIGQQRGIEPIATNSKQERHQHILTYLLSGLAKGGNWTHKNRSQTGNASTCLNRSIIWSCPKWDRAHNLRTQREKTSIYFNTSTLLYTIPSLLVIYYRLEPATIETTRNTTNTSWWTGPTLWLQRSLWPKSIKLGKASIQVMVRIEPTEAKQDNASACFNCFDRNWTYIHRKVVPKPDLQAIWNNQMIFVLGQVPDSGKSIFSGMVSAAINLWTLINRARPNWYASKAKSQIGVTENIEHGLKKTYYYGTWTHAQILQRAPLQGIDIAFFSKKNWEPTKYLCFVDHNPEWKMQQCKNANFPAQRSTFSDLSLTISNSFFPPWFPL